MIITPQMQIPNEWTFKDDSVASHFEQHVREQLPWYDVVSNAVALIVRHYAEPGSKVYDVGASTGNLARRLERTIETRGLQYIPIEPSEQMRKLYRGPGQDLLVPEPAETVDYKPASVFISMLTLMFIGTMDRKALIQTWMSKAQSGGAIIIVDKDEPPSGYTSQVFARITLDAKRSTGVSAEDILDKELSLSGNQRPMSQALVLDMAEKHPRVASVTEFFRFGDFYGLLLEIAQ